MLEITFTAFAQVHIKKYLRTNSISFIVNDLYFICNTYHILNIEIKK